MSKAIGLVVGFLGWVLTAIGYIGYVVFGLWGFLLSLMIVSIVAGFWGVVVGVAIAPLTFTVAPLYVLIRVGNWYPALISYGGIAVSWLALIAGSALLAWKEEII